MVTVVAPAGWGKTTLLAGWAREIGSSRPVAWLSLDEADDEPVRFWTYALSAVERVAPQLTSDALATLRASGLDPVQLALESFLNACATSPAGGVLVLDDYHVVTDPAVHASMEFLLGYLPDGSLQVVLAGRADPPLPLARLRARGDLAEIRLKDLRCSPAEGSALMAAVGGDRAAAEAPAAVRRTEGWAAALQLTAMAMREGRPGSELTGPGGRDRHVLDYVAAEVLPGLTTTERDLLVRCSVLDRLTGALCDAVLETHGSPAVLERLARTDMFVVELAHPGDETVQSRQDHEPWYRCHQLLRQALRRELYQTGPGVSAGLLTRASQWFLDAGRVEEAVAHLLAAGDDSAAVSLLARHTRWFLDHGAMAALLKLGAGPAAQAADPHLYLSLAFAGGLSGQPDEVVRWLRLAEPLITADTPPLPGWRSLRAGAEATWAAYALERDIEAALRHAHEAVELESDPDLWGYVVARQSLAAALLVADDVDAAVAVLRETWRLPVRHELPLLLTLQHAGHLALALVTAGHQDEARAVAAEVAERAREAELAWGPGAAAALAALRLAESELESARDPAAALPNLRHAAALAERWGQPHMAVFALLAVAEAEWATGDRAAARQSLGIAGDIVATETAVPATRRRYEELQHRIGRSAATEARAQGGLVEALTDRELSILRALRGPLSAREIASELFLSINTVKGYTKSLYRKLDVATRTDAVRRGYELGLI
jgi:LuxR family maltose regulon positive regulatory protein